MNEMNERMALLAALAESVWTSQAHELEWLVKAAYSAGATSEDLYTAVESGCLLGNPPPKVVTQAYATIDTWKWMAGCRLGHQSNTWRPKSHVL